MLFYIYHDYEKGNNYFTKISFFQLACQLSRETDQPAGSIAAASLINNYQTTTNPMNSWPAQHTTDSCRVLSHTISWPAQHQTDSCRVLSPIIRWPAQHQTDSCRVLSHTISWPAQRQADSCRVLSHTISWPAQHQTDSWVDSCQRKMWCCQWWGQLWMPEEI